MRSGGPARIGSAAARFIAALALVMAFLACQPAQAETAVDVELVLAVDVSGSVSQERFVLQQRGYAAAFRDPRLLQAILSGPARSIAVTMTQWTGPAMQVQVVPWTLIADEASMRAFADAIEKAQRQLFSGGTSISGAIDHAVTLFSKDAYKGARRVVDISGDGSNNRGRAAVDARDEAVRAGVVINGLPILMVEPFLDQYYWTNVIGGPNAFVIAVDSYEAFAEAVLKKLIIEVSALPAASGTATVGFTQRRCDLCSLWEQSAARSMRLFLDCTCRSR